jgi:hypothetical protein
MEAWQERIRKREETSSRGRNVILKDKEIAEEFKEARDNEGWRRARYAILARF